MTVTENLERFHYLNFEISLLKTKTFWSTCFPLKVLRWKTQHLHTKLPRQNPFLRQIKRGVQNGPKIKSGVLPPTTLFF